MGRFYKYIRKRENRGYEIVKDGIAYGEYENVEDALIDRDMLIDSDWDYSEFCSRDYIPNKYYEMELPPFDELGEMYITTKTVGGEKRYIIQKRVKKKVRQFGVFDNIEDAIRRRDELIERGWKK